MKKFIKLIIYVKFPMLGRLYGAIFNKESFHTFSGWGMKTTGTFPPWANIIKDKKNVHQVFIKIVLVYCLFLLVPLLQKHLK